MTTEPPDKSIKSGNSQGFHAGNRNPLPGFQWQNLDNGTTGPMSRRQRLQRHADVCLNLENTPGSLNGRRYRAIIANLSGAVTTRARR